MSNITTELDLGIVLGKEEAFSILLDIISDDEWHEQSKNYGSMTEDLYHHPGMCITCQLVDVFKDKIRESNKRLEQNINE